MTISISRCRTSSAKLFQSRTVHQQHDRLKKCEILKIQPISKRFASQYQDSSARQCHDSNVQRSHDSNARQCHDSSANRFRGNSVNRSPDSNASRFLDSSAGTEQVLSTFKETPFHVFSARVPQPKSANKYLGVSVRASLHSSAPRFPANNAVRCNAKSQDSSATPSHGSSAGT